MSLWEIAYDELRSAEGTLLDIGDAATLARIAATNKEIEHEIAVLEAIQNGKYSVSKRRHRRSSRRLVEK